MSGRERRKGAMKPTLPRRVAPDSTSGHNLIGSSHWFAGEAGVDAQNMCKMGLESIHSLFDTHIPSNITSLSSIAVTV
jgi:hypothetical protein